MIQMKQQKCLLLPTDLSVVDFIKGCMLCSHHRDSTCIIFLERHFAIQFRKAVPTEKLFPNSHVLSVSLVCPVKGLKMLQPSALAAAWPAIWLTYGLPSLLPVSFCSLMWDSPAGAHGEDQNQLGSDLSKGTHFSHSSNKVKQLAKSY